MRALQTVRDVDWIKGGAGFHSGSEPADDNQFFTLLNLFPLLTVLSCLAVSNTFVFQNWLNLKNEKLNRSNGTNPNYRKLKMIRKRKVRINHKCERCDFRTESKGDVWRIILLYTRVRNPSRAYFPGAVFERGGNLDFRIIWLHTFLIDAKWSYIVVINVASEQTQFAEEGNSCVCSN